MSTSERPRLGIALLVFANGLTASVDGFAKYLSPDVHSVQITWGYFLGIFLGFVAYASLRRIRLPATMRTRRVRRQLARSAMLVLSIACLFLGVAHIPFADAIAISFMAPLFVTVLSGPLLGERMGWHRVGAVLAGLVGVVIIMRPGAGAVHWAAFMSLAGAAFFALFQIMTRQLAATEDSATTLFYTAAGGLFWTSLAVGFFWRPVAGEHLVVYAIVGALGITAHFCMIKAFEFAQASLLAPFYYAKLIWAALIGVAVFGELPGTATFLGSAVIAAGGIYVIYREGRVGRPA
jgi:drug/metabolite transporter (DMT)-like permease